jgi:exodeoxyribonuclease VII large subunit
MAQSGEEIARGMVEPRLGPQLLARRQAEFGERLKNLSLRAEAGLSKVVDRSRLTYDPRAAKLATSARLLVERKRAQLDAIGPKLSANALRAELRHGQTRLGPLGTRLYASMLQGLSLRGTALAQAGKLLDSLSYKSVLARGYAVIKDADGRLVHEREWLLPGTPIAIEFTDGDVSATISGSPVIKRKPRSQSDKDTQESLF